MSANNTSATYHTITYQTFFVCCEIIMSNVISHEIANKCFIIRKKKNLVHMFPNFCFLFVCLFVCFISRFTRTAYSVHVINAASGLNWNIRSRVKYRLSESLILQLALITSRRPAPKSAIIPIPSATVYVAPAHCNISSNELRTSMAFHCCK